jgi:signal transduction histidine kinase
VAQSTSLPETVDPDFPPQLRDDGFVVIQPLDLTDREGGAILVGPRTNGRRYVEPDLEHLAACARIAAQHLERIGLVRTVAEETLARERLAELNRHKSDFLSHVAHDLRTPVTGITWSARNLADGVVGPLSEPQAEYVTSIAESAEHLNRLVGNLLEISRLDRAEAPLELAPVDPGSVWHRAMRTIEPLALAKNVTLVRTGDDPAPAVQGHADKLVEVAVNLLDNAVKYTGPGTTVTVHCHRPTSASHTVSVRDQGPGLGDQSPEDLMARFVQGAPSPSSSRKGFGLGLHIAITYLELMGGTLAASNHPDGGAEFRCELPLAATAPSPDSKGAPP